MGAAAWEYVRALAGRYVTFGWAVLVAGVGAASAHWDVPAWLWWSAILGGFFVAQIAVWVDMRRQRDALIPQQLVEVQDFTRTGARLEVRLINKTVTLDDVQINALVPKVAQRDVKRLRGDMTPGHGRQDTITDTDVCPDGAPVLRWSEDGVRLRGGNTVSSWFFYIDVAADPFKMKLSLGGSDALLTWYHFPLDIPAIPGWTPVA
jgi:hypothetical protein